MTPNSFLCGFSDMRRHPNFPKGLDHVAQVALYKLWIEIENAPAEPRKATPAQQRTLFLALKRGWLDRDEVGQVTALTVDRASELIEIAFARRDRGPGGLGFEFDYVEKT